MEDGPRDLPGPVPRGRAGRGPSRLSVDLAANLAGRSVVRPGQGLVPVADGLAARLRFRNAAAPGARRFFTARAKCLIVGTEIADKGGPLLAVAGVGCERTLPRASARRPVLSRKKHAPDNLIPVRPDETVASPRREAGEPDRHGPREHLGGDGMTQRAALFLDRDGVVIEDRGYVHRMEDVALMPGIVELCEAARGLGLAVVVVTNQSGIARGLFDEATYARFTAALRQELASRGAVLDAVYHCPHHPTEGKPPFRGPCGCRKPEPGLFLRAAAELGLDLGRSVMVGDQPTDIDAAWRAGLGHTILLAARPAAACHPTATCPTLEEARLSMEAMFKRSRAAMVPLDSGEA